MLIVLLFIEIGNSSPQLSVIVSSAPGTTSHVQAICCGNYFPTDVWSHAWEEMLVFDFSEKKNKIRKSTVLVYVT